MNKSLPYLRSLRRNPTLEEFFPLSATMPIELWPRERVVRYRMEALRFVVDHAQRHNAFYAKRFAEAGVDVRNLKEPADVEGLPTLCKSDLRGDPWRLLSVPRREICQVHLSTGTTSTSIDDHIYRLLSWEDIYLNEVSTRGLRSLTSPTRPGDVVVIALPYEMSSAGLALHRTYQYAARAAVVNVGKGGFYSHPLKTLFAMKDLRANIVITSPSYAIKLHEIAKYYGSTLANYVTPKLLWLTGEPCSDNLRERLARLWDCTALRFYGSLECGALGAECVRAKGFHIFESHVFVEVLDPQSGKALPNGMVGEICVSVLNKTGQPLIRYRTEDLGFIDDTECPCCSNAPRIVLRGRTQSQLTLRTGQYSPVVIENVLFGIEGVGNNYELVVRGGGLTVRVEAESKGANRDELREKIHRRVECYVGAVDDVEIVESFADTGGKAKRVNIQDS